MVKPTSDGKQSLTTLATYDEESMIRKPCTVRQVSNHHFEIDDPNNNTCPVVGPFKGTNTARIKIEANETARRLNRFYKRNWKTWSQLCNEDAS